MRTSDALLALRDEARAFERAMPMSERKAWGRFFTGTKVSRVLAHLAINDSTSRILDPMAGTGDLLEAAAEAAQHRGLPARHLDAIEIDPESADICERRLHLLAEQGGSQYRMLRGDAFAADTHEQLGEAGYDLVIANPPYVRYQSMAERAARTRRGLSRGVCRHLRGPARHVWSALAESYSGLADLSVPAWLLCAMLVRPGGRLALVTPATWRSRDYASALRYLTLRAFELEFVVEDLQRCWFPDALVGTHLVVARRLSDAATEVPLSQRTDWPPSRWVTIPSRAASATSLVGDVFKTACPESDFANWCRNGAGRTPQGELIAARPFALAREWATLARRADKGAWLGGLEALPRACAESLPRRASRTTGGDSLGLPHALVHLLPSGLVTDKLVGLRELGIHVGQGLRTGCNRFFYVRLVEALCPDWSIVVTDAAFGSRRLRVPSATLRPVLHRQRELAASGGCCATTHVLDLRDWVLPEDQPAVGAAKAVYARTGRPQPRPMPDELAQHVRHAASQPVPGAATDKPVAALSAVRTNVRAARANCPPRFWYMLPDFKPRHQPDAFVPRVVHHAPRTYANRSRELLVDANFSTFWSDREQWSPKVLAALLSSAWCSTLMEATGTPLGGGALKLEASHLRQLSVPFVTSDAVARIHDAAESDCGPSPAVVDRLVAESLIGASASPTEVDALTASLLGCAEALRNVRTAPAR